MAGETLEYVFDSHEGERLDRFLTARLPDYSRSRLQSIIKDGFVHVDGIKARKTGQMLGQGARIVIELPPPQPSGLKAENIPLDILFENGDVLVVNKPAGMVVHPSAGHSSGTLVNAALAHAPDIQGVGGQVRPGVVHRLDKDTSGVILLAKNDLAHRALQAQFRDRSVQKTYTTLVDGAPPTLSGVVEAVIGRDKRNRKRMAVVPPGRGREAETEYHTIEAFQAFTLLQAHPRTGRTHQIRVHMAFLGCPVVGDRVYGRKKPSLKIRRQFLHASFITLLLPGDSAPRTFSAPLPSGLENILQDLRMKKR